MLFPLLTVKIMPIERRNPELSESLSFNDRVVWEEGRETQCLQLGLLQVIWHSYPYPLAQLLVPVKRQPCLMICVG